MPNTHLDKPELDMLETLENTGDNGNDGMPKRVFENTFYGMLERFDNSLIRVITGNIEGNSHATPERYNKDFVVLTDAGRKMLAEARDEKQKAISREKIDNERWVIANERANRLEEQANRAEQRAVNAEERADIALWIAAGSAIVSIVVGLVAIF